MWFRVLLVCLFFSQSSSVSHATAEEPPRIENAKPFLELDTDISSLNLDAATKTALQQARWMQEQGCQKGLAPDSNFFLDLIHGASMEEGLRGEIVLLFLDMAPATLNLEVVGAPQKFTNRETIYQGTFEHMAGRARVDLSLKGDPSRTFGLIIWEHPVPRTLYWEGDRYTESLSQGFELPGRQYYCNVSGPILSLVSTPSSRSSQMPRFERTIRGCRVPSFAEIDGNCFAVFARPHEAYFGNTRPHHHIDWFGGYTPVVQVFDFRPENTAGIDWIVVDTASGYVTRQIRVDEFVSDLGMLRSRAARTCILTNVQKGPLPDERFDVDRMKLGRTKK